MDKPFDTTLKHLLEKYPQDWLKLLGIDVKGPVKSLDADMATVSAAADKVLQVKDKRDWLAYLEVQSSYKRNVPDRLLLGNTVLYHRHKLPVRSVAVLLRPEADGPAMTGIVHRRCPPDFQYLDFRYDVVRIWRLPLEPLLSAGLGTLPLALLSDES